MVAPHEQASAHPAQCEYFCTRATGVARKPRRHDGGLVCTCRTILSIHGSLTGTPLERPNDVSRAHTRIARPSGRRMISKCALPPATNAPLTAPCASSSHASPARGKLGSPRRDSYYVFWRNSVMTQLPVIRIRARGNRPVLLSVSPFLVGHRAIRVARRVVRVVRVARRLSPRRGSYYVFWRNSVMTLLLVCAHYVF